MPCPLAMLRPRPPAPPVAPERTPPDSFVARMIQEGIRCGLAAAEREAQAQRSTLAEDLDLLDAELVRTDCARVLIR